MSGDSRTLPRPASDKDASALRTRVRSRDKVLTKRLRQYGYKWSGD